MATDPDQSKEGWGTDPLSHSQDSRWSTEGGLWTEDRRQADDKDYVPKNARWNDEERGERWKTAPARGRGQSRSQGGRRIHSDVVGSMSDLNGRHPDDLHLKRGDHGGTLKRYSRKTLLDISDQLKSNTRNHHLPLPTFFDSASHHELIRERKQVEEIPSPTKESPVVASSPPLSSPVAGIGPDELEADSWVYKDPSGQVQGPFSKQEVLAWWDEGYFPPELPVQSQLSAKENWVPIKKLLKLWNVSVDETSTTPITSSKGPSSRKLEASDSLATVGSRILSSLIPEASSAEMSEEFHVSQPPTESHIPQAAAIQGLTNPVSRSPRQQMPTQNPVSDLQQSMQNLLLQHQQKQAAAQQQGAGMGGGGAGLNFNTNTAALGAAAGLSGLRQSMPYQQNASLMGTYGLHQQQQQTGLQENSMISPQILEALQRTTQRPQPQQSFNRPQSQTSPYGFDMNSGLSNPLQSQLHANPNLAAVFAQNQMAAQRAADPRIPNDLQRLLQARQLQNQSNAFGGMNNQLGSGIFNPGMRATSYMQPQQQTQQNPWATQNQVPGVNYSALNSLLQHGQQQLTTQQTQVARAMLWNKLQQNIRFPNQQMGNVAHPGMQQNRDSLLAALHGGDPSALESLNQARQRNNMSPPSHPHFQSSVDPNFSLTSQNTIPSATTSLPQFSYGAAAASQRGSPPFPQHILHQLNPSNVDMANPVGMEIHRTSTPPTLGLDSPHPPTMLEESARMSPDGMQKPKNNAWGVTSASPAMPTSLLEIQEQESKTAMQSAVIKEKQGLPPTAVVPTGPGWNVQHVKPIPLVDIMQEDAETQRQNQALAQARQQAILQPPSNESQGNVWSKKTRSQSGSQSGDKGSSGGVVSKERSAKEEQDEGLWNLESSASGPTDVSRDLSHHDSSVESEVRLFPGQLKMSQQFRDWCKRNMIALGGPGDMALIEFLLSLKSRSEIAEYIQEYFKTAPSEKLSVFISEFMKMKDNEATRTKKERGGQKSKKKSSKQKDIAAAAAKSSANSNATIKNNSAELDTVSLETSESHGHDEKTTSTSTRTRDNTKSKPKTKKQTKGQHIPADMLGFKSNVNFGALYRDNSNG